MVAARLAGSLIPGGRALMSTAGKVLVVLVTLTTLVWIILAAGVARLNTNGNKALHDLSEQVAKAEVDLETTQQDIVSLRDETASNQEKVDRDLAVLRSRLADVEKARSQILEGLDRIQYQTEHVQETIKAAQANLEHRNAEKQAEEKALADARSEVETFVASSSQLRDQLKNLREKFQSRYKANVQMVGKSSLIETESRAGKD